MFEVGRAYKVTSIHGDETSYTTAAVIEVDMPLVKFSSPGNYIIINTSSPSFVSAAPNDAKAREDEAAENRRFIDSISINFDEADKHL
jgi:arginine/lysine/ornithine decarboxylase